MANLDINSMFNGRITSGDNSEKLGLRVTRDMGRYTITECTRPPLFCGKFNMSAYQLACGLCADGSAYVDLYGSMIIGRKSTPDGWVPQVANKMLKRWRGAGSKLVKEFMAFLDACLLDDNTSVEDTFFLPSKINTFEEIRVDLNLVASHSIEMPTWMDEDPSVVLSYLSIRSTGDLRVILKGFAQTVNGDWNLG